MGICGDARRAIIAAVLIRHSAYLCHAERRISGRLRPIIRSRSTPTPSTKLHSQLHDCRPTPTFILRRLGYRFHVRMLLQILTQGFP